MQTIVSASLIVTKPDMRRKVVDFLTLEACFPTGSFPTTPAGSFPTTPVGCDTTASRLEMSGRITSVMPRKRVGLQRYLLLGDRSDKSRMSAVEK